jgi:hypothetical protein
MSVIFQWLERIGLGYAVPHFQAAGITTPQQLAAIEMAEGAADRLNIANGAYAGGAPLRRNRARRARGVVGPPVFFTPTSPLPFSAADDKKRLWELIHRIRTVCAQLSALQDGGSRTLSPHPSRRERAFSVGDSGTLARTLPALRRPPLTPAPLSPHLAGRVQGQGA